MKTVLFHRNGQSYWSGLQLSDIEYYLDGESIESAYVVNGCWNLYIDEQDVMYSYATDYPRSRGCKPVTTWKSDEVRIVKVDVKGDYNTVIRAAEELL